MLEVEPTSKRKEKESYIKIADITQAITINNNKFTLIGIIQLIPILRHFVAHIKSDKGWEVYDNLTSKVSKSTSSDILPYLLFFLKKQ